MRDGIGLSVEPPDAEWQCPKRQRASVATWEKARTAECGLVVCVLDSKEKSDCVEWRRLLEKLRPDCVVPVVRRHDGDVYETLIVMCSDCGDDTLAHVAHDKGKQLGEEMLQALARKVGAAMLHKSIWRDADGRAGRRPSET